MISYLFRHLGWMLRHPLNRGRPLRTLWRFVAWHLGSRLLREPVLYPFVNELRVFVRTGFWGATGVVHFGMQEFPEMAFCAHLLRPGDRFADVGACFGTYTLIASGVAGADSVAFEPNPRTAHWLRENLHVNRLESRVRIVDAAVGAAPGMIDMTDGLAAANHVVGAGEYSTTPRIRVPVTTLDHETRNAHPTLVKIDVEGFEQQVLAGAVEVLADPSLLALIVEDVGLRARYSSDSEIHTGLLAAGFRSYEYDPARRDLIELGAMRNTRSFNTLYVRDMARVRDRLASSAQFRCRGQTI